MIIASSSPKEIDALVVGAGPAGASAARTLAAAGARVTLLDRAEFPRNKPCGGGISLRILRRFPYLESALPKIATHTVSRLHLEGPDGTATVVDAGEPAALMIRRFEFDALLVSLATEAGATLVAGADIAQARETADGVTLTARDGREFQAPVIVAADGVHSVVARRLGLNRGWPASAVALDMMEETARTELRDVDPSTLWVKYGFQATAENAENAERKNGSASSARSAVAFPQGYAYVFPKHDHVNIGIGYVLSYFRESIDAAPYDLQRRFVATLRERGVVTGESVEANFTPFLLPVNGPLPVVARGRVLVAGDAGGFVNAFTAEGIYYAMVSGELAAQAILGSRGDLRAAAGIYRRACDHEIGTELRDSVIIQRYLFHDSRRIARAIRGAHRAPGITNLVCNLVTGRRSYYDARRRILARSPALAVRTAWEYLLSRRATALRI